MKFYEVSKSVVNINLIFIPILILLSFLEYVKISLILSTFFAFVIILILTFILETISFVNTLFKDI